MDEIESDGAAIVVGRTVDDSGAPVITLSGELDISNVDELRAVVERSVAEKPSRLVFDVTDLSFIDSSGIAVMVYGANNVAEVVLRHPSTIVRRVIEATGLSDVLRFDPS